VMRGLVYLYCLVQFVNSISGQQLKRAPFNSWAGKRYDPSLSIPQPINDDTNMDMREYGSYLPYMLQIPLTGAGMPGMDKRGGRPRAFSSWAGKRAPFSSWAGKRSGASVERPEWYQEDYARKKRSSEAADLI